MAATNRKYGVEILLIGLLLVSSGVFLIHAYFTNKQEIVCGTDIVKKSIKELSDSVSQKIIEQTDRVNCRLDYIAGWRDPCRYK